MIIVTGANGFIGQHLIPQLLKKIPEQKVIPIIGKTDKLHEKKGLEIIQKLKLKFLTIDLLNLKQLSRIPSNPGVLVHLASAVDTGSTDFRVNNLGTENLVNCLKKINQNTHVIYTSTAAIWGGRKKFNSLTELTEPDPNNEYGRTKLIGEEILKKVCLKKGFRLTILRLNTVYGKDLRQDKLFGMVQKMIENNSFIIRLNWPGKFGVVHVDDVCKAIIKVIKKPPQKGQIRTLIVSTENVDLPLISKLISNKIGKKYQPILIPNFLWQVMKNIRHVSNISETRLPAWLHNSIWRSTLITNDVLKASGANFGKQISKWKRKRIKKYIGDVIINKYEK